MNRLKNKVAIITGAAGGMGAAEAQLFAQEGARVIATDIQEAKLQQWVKTAQQQGLEIDSIRHDVSSKEDWQTVVDFTIKRFGRIDILVNNAGIYPPGATTETTTAEQWEKVIAINLTGPFLGVQACLPHMKQNGGSIIHIASIAGMVGGSGPAYSASKGGLRLLAKDQAVELAKYNIRVNSIHPGGVLTPMTQFLVSMPENEAIMHNMCPMGRIGQSLEIANGALFLASDESSYTTGAELVIDGGMIAR
jgi:NAD(P)-dependent dehydrogenase (short-subunit alcohol dehydrogenase family)